MNEPSVSSRTTGLTRWRAKTLASLILTVAFLPVANTAAQGPDAVPDRAGQVMLIRNTVTAVNHGNITGNYTVLRDLGSERFRRRNKAGDLSTTFANLRKQAGDLSPILVIEPQLTQRPYQDQYGRMQLVGYFPTRPQAVRFDLIFQKVDGAWIIDEITVGVAPIESFFPPQRVSPSPPLQQSPQTAPRPQTHESPPLRR